MDTLSHANTVYLKNFDTEIKKIVDDLTLIKEEKFHHEEHMAILQVLNFNVKQISDKQMSKLFSLEVVGKLEGLLRGFKAEEDLEGVEIICHIFSNLFLSKRTVQHVERNHRKSVLIETFYELLSLSSEINLACMDIFERFQS